MSKVILITGASSGMGKSAAKILHKKGHTVYGAAPDIGMMKELEDSGIATVPLELTREKSIFDCFNTVFRKEGQIDVLINNAGYGSYGAVEDVTIEEAKRQFEVNIFGLARITKLVLPGMRERKSGRIINISSMGGKIYTPFGAWYHATKYALEGWSDCLRLELKEFGIDVVVIEPGGIKTPWGVIASENLKRASGAGPYAKAANRVADGLMKIYTSNTLTNVDVLGRVIAKAATTKKPRTRYVKGYMARPAIAVRKWLGDSIYDKMVVTQL